MPDENLFYVIDLTIFYWINHDLCNVFFDWFMPLVTNLRNWLVPLAILVLLMLIKGGRREKIIIILLFPTILLSDQLSSHIIKPLVGRIRPCNALPDVHLLVKSTKSRSFPSSHAANMAAASVIFAYYYRYWWWIFANIAVIIGFSRIYVGVHYPGDVLGGFFVGSGCAAIVLLCYCHWFEKNISGRKKSDQTL